MDEDDVRQAKEGFERRRLTKGGKAREIAVRREARKKAKRPRPLGYAEKTMPPSASASDALEEIEVGCEWVCLNDSYAKWLRGRSRPHIEEDDE